MAHIAVADGLRIISIFHWVATERERSVLYVNLMITMLMGGLWHGAYLRFIIWGGLHGIGLVVNKIWDSIFGRRHQNRTVWKGIFYFYYLPVCQFLLDFFQGSGYE